MVRVWEAPAPAGGRYVVREQIATGGMATVHLGQLVGPGGFIRVVAVKRLGPALAEDREAVAMLLDEARLAARLHHPNVAATIDVVIEPHDACIVMEYVHGESLSRLLSTEGTVRPSAGVVSAIVIGMLRGLHVAHEVCDERGEPLEIIHRDVSPQNVIVGADGVSRLIDFGIAKARRRLQSTTEGQLKGKLSYLSPEQIRGAPATRRTDIYSAGIVLWEALTRKRLFDGDCAGAITEQILVGWVDRPSKHVCELPEGLDDVTLRALEPDPARRFQTAAEMADALESALAPASPAQVADWVRCTASGTLARRAELLRAMEAGGQFTTEGKARRGAYRAMGMALLAATLLAGVAALLKVPSSAADVPSLARSPEPPRPPNVPAGATSRLTVDDEEPRPRADETEPPGRALAPAQAPLNKAPRASRPPARSASPRASNDFCNPPYEVDEQGIRHYKRPCLQQ